MRGPTVRQQPTPHERDDERLVRPTEIPDGDGDSSDEEDMQTIQRLNHWWVTPRDLDLWVGVRHQGDHNPHEDMLEHVMQSNP